MKLRNIYAFGHNFDLTVERVNKKLKITVSEGKKILINKIIKEGDTINMQI
ncbi:hypothetical protein D3C85_1920960 [compost metagenome]